MATGGVAQKSLSSDGSTVRLFVTSYTDDFFAEREILKKEVNWSCKIILGDIGDQSKLWL